MNEMKELDPTLMDEAVGGLCYPSLPEVEISALNMLIRAHKQVGATLEDLLNKMTENKKPDQEFVNGWKDYVRAYWDRV